MGEGITKRNGGGVQTRRAAKSVFTKAKRERFLDALALTCNVRRAAEHAGVEKTAPYRLRRNDAVFAERWNEALAMGRDRLEALLIEHGGAGERLDDPDPERAADEGGLPPFDFDRAVRVLQLFQAGEGRLASTRGHRRGATREVTTAALMKALAAAKRRVDRALATDE